MRVVSLSKKRFKVFFLVFAPHWKYQGEGGLIQVMGIIQMKINPPYAMLMHAIYKNFSFLHETIVT
jgi:hypothetical protein